MVDFLGRLERPKGFIVAAKTTYTKKPAQTRARFGSRSKTVASLREALHVAWTRETSYDPLNWSNENAAWGQCAVTALIVQDYCGGRLVCGEVNGIPHYWNRVSPKKEIDLTQHQFGRICNRSTIQECEREFVLSFPETARRYRQLQTRLAQKMKRVATN